MIKNMKCIEPNCRLTLNKIYRIEDVGCLCGSSTVFYRSLNDDNEPEDFVSWRFEDIKLLEINSNIKVL